jgi:hypothetical protein
MSSNTILIPCTWRSYIYCILFYIIHNPNFNSTDRASLCQDKNVYTCYVHFFVCKHYLYCSVRIKRIALNICCHSLCPIQSANILSKWNMFNSTTIVLQLFVGGSCLINDICVYLHILASNTCYIVFLFCLSSSCVRSVASFFGLSIYDCPIANIICTVRLE